MKVLVITQKKLLPMTDGALIGSMGLLNYLHDLGHVIQIVHFIEDEQYTDEELNELKTIVEDIHTVKLYWRNTALNMSLRYPNSIRKYKRNAMTKKVEYVIEHFKPDFGVIDHTQMYEYAKCFENMYYVLHTHNVESNVWFDYAKDKKGLVKALVLRTAKMMRNYEINALRLSPSVTACSETDEQFFRELYPKTNVATFHSYLKFPLVKTEEDVRETNNAIVFIGSYGWYPNQQAASFLANKVFPKLKKIIPDIKLYLVGKEPTTEILNYQKLDENIIVTGIVDSVDPYLKKSDVFVNAIEDGGGINIKLIETMGKGIPIVTSEFGSRGMKIQEGYNALTYSNEDECVEKIVKLINDKELAINCARNARREYEAFIQPNETVRAMFSSRQYFI